jgi:hypothetical protein
MRAEHRDYLEAIETEKKWDDSIAERTRKLVERFNRQFGVEGTPAEESEEPAQDEPAAEAPKPKRSRKKAAS